jgi:hypothetical protein
MAQSHHNASVFEEYILDLSIFIRLRLNTLSAIVLWRTAGMKGKVNRVEAHQRAGGLCYGAIPL